MCQVICNYLLIYGQVRSFLFIVQLVPSYLSLGTIAEIYKICTLLT